MMRWVRRQVVSVFVKYHGDRSGLMQVFTQAEVDALIASHTLLNPLFWKLTLQLPLLMALKVYACLAEITELCQKWA
jgi:hypothetical protein